MKHLLITLISLALWGQMTLLRAELIEVDNRNLEDLLDQNTLIVDVRREDEWKATGTVAGSQLLTFFDQQGGYDAQVWLRKLSQLADVSTPVILICDSGVRSRVIGNWMSASLGFDRVYNVSDGIQRWRQAGYPVQTYPATTE